MVSIIVPVYNVEKYLAQCVASLVAQTCREIEILLVDDGSTDRSGVLCDRLRESDARIVVIHKENGGQNSAVKAGLERAAGEQIAFVDSDDWVEKTYVEVMLDAMQRHDCELVCANGYRNADIETAMALHHCADGIYEGQDIPENIFPGLFSCVDAGGYRITPSRCAKLFLRELLLKNIGYYQDGIQLGEDSLMTYPYVLCCRRMVFIPDRIYHYRVRPESITTQFQKKNLEDLLFCARQHARMAEALSDFDFSKQLAAERIAIVYQSLHEIAQNAHPGNTGEMYRYFKETLHAFPAYPVLPYSDCRRVRLQYRMIRRKQTLGLWLLMQLGKLRRLRKH